MSQLTNKITLLYLRNLCGFILYFVVVTEVQLSEKNSFRDPYLRDEITLRK
jgi:hypothetical protein